MEESSTLKLIIEKGPREGETLEYSPASIVKIGRLVRGNTIGIKDAGISSKHISIQFDNNLSKWNLTDLDSSNGTILNGTMLLPNVPSNLNDGDCIKIGESTSIIVKIEIQLTIPSERNPRRRRKSGADAVVERNQSELGLGLGFDGDLGEKVVRKRNLRSRAKKVVDLNNEVESLNSERILRSSRKEEKASSILTLDTNANVRETTDEIVPIEGRVTRGRMKKLQMQISKDSDLDNKGKPADIVVPIDGKKSRRGRKRLAVEPLEELRICESVRVDASENVVENNAVEENLDTNNESSQDNVAEKPVSIKESCEEQETMADQSLAKGLSLQVQVDKGHDSVKEIGVDTSKWQDLEKMTLGDFFDYLEWQLPKEIREKTEEIVSLLPEKARIYREVRP